MMDANINISAVNYNCKTHLNILSCYVVLLFLLMVCVVVVVVVLAVVCACVYVWLFSFNYTIWRLYLFLTSFFNLCTLVALFICVRSLFCSMSLSLHSFWQGTLFVYYYNSARSFRYHFLFCSCKSDVGLFRFVSFRLCWKGDIVQHISTWNNFWRAVFMRLCASKSVFSILQNFASFLLVKIFI